MPVHTRGSNAEASGAAAHTRGRHMEDAGMANGAEDEEAQEFQDATSGEDAAVGEPSSAVEASSGDAGQEEEDNDEDEDEDEEWEPEEEAVYSETDGEEEIYELINRAAGAAYSRQLARFPLLRDWVPPVMRHELAAELSMRSAAASPRGAPHPLARPSSAGSPPAAAAGSPVCTSSRSSRGCGDDRGDGAAAQGAPDGTAAPDSASTRTPRRRRLEGSEGMAEGAGAGAGESGGRSHPRRDSLQVSEGIAGRAAAGQVEPPSPSGAPTPSRRRLNPAHALLLREARQGSGGGCMLPEQCAHFAAFHRLPSSPRAVIEQRSSRAYIGQFTPDGNIFIAAFQSERKIRLYTVHNEWQLAKDIHARGLQWTVTDTALSSDNRFLLYSSITPEVHLVNIESSGGVESVANVTDIHETLDFSGGRQQRLGIWSIQWSADDREIVAGTSDPGIRIYDLTQFKTVATAGGHDDDVNAVAYAERESPNVIFSGSDDTFVKVWDRRTLDASARRARPAGVFVGHTEGITHLDSKGDGRYVISNAKDQSIKLWDVRMMVSEKAAQELSSDVPTFHWDYRWMNYPGHGRAVQHPQCQAVQTYRGHTVLSTLIRSYWSPPATTGQRYIYSGSYDGRVHIYDVITAQPVARLSGYHQECVRDCGWHPYLPLIATVSFDGAVTTWEPQVPGEDEALDDEAAAAAAVAERRQHGSGRRAGRRTRQRQLPRPLGDQHAW